MNLFKSRRHIVACLLMLTVAVSAYAGPLKDYVEKPDPNYAFAMVNEIEGSGYTGYVLDMTAQSWKAGQVSHPVWRHWVTIIVPDTVEFDSALLLVSGGNNKHEAPPSKVESFLALIAQQTRSIVVELQGIPNEPVTFSDEDRTRTEDEIIAYTYDKFLTTGDETWPLLLPMVKSTVRAMDSVQKYMSEEAESKHTINNFVVAGASKRGWTTYLTAAVDDRVTAIAPVVIDMLNLDEQMVQTMDYYGKYTAATQDYTEFGIQDKMDTKEGQALLKIVDPLEYRSALTMPKFILLGAGDQYWTIDSANLYFDKLKGPKYIRYAPNADHGIDNSMPSILALANFYYSIISDTPLPEFSWKLEKDGSFEVTAADAPISVNLWTASAPTMDFRLKTIGAAWTSVPVQAKDGMYKGNVPEPESGYSAYFVELIYPGPLGMDYSYTTQIGIPGKAISAGSPVIAILMLSIPLLLIGGVFYVANRK